MVRRGQRPARVTGGDPPAVRPDVSAVAWPALPNPNGALLLAMQQQFRQTERWPPDVMEQHQLSALHALVRHAATTVPFYCDRSEYASAAAAPTGSAEAWNALPVLSRAVVQEAGDALRSTAAGGDHAPFYDAVTSGSTGRPVRAVGTRITALFWQALTLREMLWHGRDVTGKLASIRAEGSDTMPADGRRLEAWGPATMSLFDTGPCVLFSIQSDVDAQARWLQDEQPDYLLTYPSNLLDLARYFESDAGRLERLRGALTYGEVLAPGVREACRRVWGVDVVDMYSSQEIGYIALQCPAGDQYHVQSETVRVEVVDDGGQPSGPGEVGRVVVTPLHNFAMPLLRYEVGDYAEVGDGCGCGRTLPVLRRVLGRQRNMLTVVGGARRWPVFPAKDWAHISGIRQLQLAQTALDRIEARVVAARPLAAADEQELVTVLERRFPGFVISVDQRADIDRTRTKKFEDFVSYV